MDSKNNSRLQASTSQVEDSSASESSVQSSSSANTSSSVDVKTKILQQANQKNIQSLDLMKVNKNSNYGVVSMRKGVPVRMKASGTIIKEMRLLQKSTALSFPRTAFSRLVKEISQKYGTYSFQSLALEALQESTELFLIGFLSDSYLLTKHRKRETLDAHDMRLLRALFTDLIPSLQEC